MPLSKPCPGIDRNVIALACVAMTERPIVPHPVDWLPRRYVLRLRMWRVRQNPYAAMPTMVPTRTSQSARFTTRAASRQRGSREKPREYGEERHHERKPTEHKQVDSPPRSKSGQTRWFGGVVALVGPDHLPTETRFAKSRYAPGTASGSCRNHARLV